MSFGSGSFQISCAPASSRSTMWILVHVHTFCKAVRPRQPETNYERKRRLWSSDSWLRLVLGRLCSNYPSADGLCLSSAFCIELGGGQRLDAYVMFSYRSLFVACVSKFASAASSRHLHTSVRLWTSYFSQECIPGSPCWNLKGGDGKAGCLAEIYGAVFTRDASRSLLPPHTTPYIFASGFGSLSRYGLQEICHKRIGLKLSFGSLRLLYVERTYRRSI